MKMRNVLGFGWRVAEEGQEVHSNLGMGQHIVFGMGDDEFGLMNDRTVLEVDPVDVGSCDFL
jgi:hypothetical protein